MWLLVLLNRSTTIVNREYTSIIKLKQMKPKKECFLKRRFKDLSKKKSFKQFHFFKTVSDSLSQLFPQMKQTSLYLVYVRSYLSLFCYYSTNTKKPLYTFYLANYIYCTWNDPEVAVILRIEDGVCPEGFRYILQEKSKHILSILI